MRFGLGEPFVRVESDDLESALLRASSSADTPLDLTYLRCPGPQSSGRNRLRSVERHQRVAIGAHDLNQRRVRPARVVASTRSIAAGLSGTTHFGSTVATALKLT
jgi:hypothetical protein